MNPPSAIHGAMSRDRKPFTYTPGGLDLSEIKSERMAKRLMRNAMNQGVPEVPVQQIQSPPIASNVAAVPNFNCLPVQVFPTFPLPANPKSLLRTRSNPDQPKDIPLQRVPSPVQFVNALKLSGMDHLRDNLNRNAPNNSQINNNNNNRPTSLYEYAPSTKNARTLPKINYGSDGYTTSLLPEISNDAEYLQIVPRDSNGTESINIVDQVERVKSTIVDHLENVTPDITVKPLSETEPISTSIVIKPVEDVTKTEDDQREVKVVKKQVKKEKKVEETEKKVQNQNGDHNGDESAEAQLTVKLPTKKSAAKTETKVEVVKKILPDGSVEEVKTTTTTTTKDGKTEISTKTETRKLPKEEADAEIEVVEEEEEEEIETKNGDVVVQEVEEESEEEEVVEEPKKVIKKTTVVKETPAAKETEQKDNIVKKEERSETTTTKKVVVVQKSAKEESDEEEVEEDEEVEEEEPVQKVNQAEKPIEKITPKQEPPLKQESKEVDEEEEEEEEEEEVVVEKKQVVESPKKQEVEEEEEEEESEEEVTEVKKEVSVPKKEEPAKQGVEEEEEEEEVEEEESQVKEEKKEVIVEKKSESVKESKEQEDEESEYTEEEEEPEKEVSKSPQESKETPKAKPKEEEPKVENKEEPAPQPEQKVPLREPSIPLEKVEDVEIKPIGRETVSKSHSENTEIITGTNERQAGALSTQTEYNRIENVVTVNRTTKTLDHSYEQLTQHGVPTVKTYFAPTRERVSTSPQPARPYQPVYPPEPTTERRHSLLLDRLSLERQVPSSDTYQNSYQYSNQSYEQQKQWLQEPQAEVVNVSNVKPSSITNQQWYQQNKKENVIYNNVTPTTPISQPWSQPQSQYQPQYQPTQNQYQPSYTDNTTQNYSRQSSNLYQQNNYPSYTPKPSTWGSSNVDTLPSINESNQYSFLNKNSSESHQQSTQRYSSSYVPPPWEQDSSYVADNSSQNYYQPPPPSTTFSPSTNQTWKPAPPPNKFSKPTPTAYIPPAPNQSFVKPVDAVEPPKIPGRKTYYSEYERRFISVPESTYVPGESKYQPQPDPSPQYYYDNNEPSEQVEHQWRKELREFTEKTSQTQHQTEQTNVKPPWEEDAKYVKTPTVTYTPTPTWSQTVRPRSWRERSFESEYVGSQDWSKTNTLGRGRPLSSYIHGNTEAIPERTRGVSVDRYNPNNYQSPIPSEHPPAQSHTLNPTATAHGQGYHNPNVLGYHSRASAEPREHTAGIQHPRQWGEARSSPLQSRSFKYLQWITGTEN